jgi:hypothetical protein
MFSKVFVNSYQVGKIRLFYRFELPQDIVDQVKTKFWLELGHQKGEQLLFWR